MNPAREAAVELLIAVLEEHRTLDEAMAGSQIYDALEGRDRAFASATARETIRHLGRVDRALAEFLDRPLPDDAWRGRAILRAGAAQLLFMQTPAHAAVKEFVDVANASRKSSGFAGMINAVLRKISTMERDLDPTHDLPDWLRTRWTATYGADVVRAMAECLQGAPPLDITPRNNAAEWARKLGGELLPVGSIRLREHDPVASLPGYNDGAWWVQDSAAVIAARLIGAKGKRVCDLCAAPGGKTLQLAAAGGEVTAVDIDEGRLRRLRRGLARTGLLAKVVCADALSWRPDEPFDAALLDAPCSSTGVLRRHPEAAWLRSPAHVKSYAETQAALLKAAPEMVKIGGMLVYSVCSLEPEEGPARIETALESGRWKRAPVTPDEVGGLAEIITEDGDVRTLPCHLADRGGMDGFYAARLIRIA